MIRAEAVREILSGASSPSTPPRSAPPHAASLKEIAAHAARHAERDAICQTLRVTGGNKSQAARNLKTDYKTLHLKMKALGIRARDYLP